MFGLFTLVFFASFLMLLIGIMSPELISNWFKQDFSRKKVGKVFGLVCLVSIIGLIVFSSSESSETISKNNPITPIQTNSVQDERIKGFFVQKFQESTKSTIQDFSIKNKVIFITLASKDNVELTAVDSAIALNRHPEVEFNQVILKNSVDQVSFDHALFDTYINNKIGDQKFIKQLEHSLVSVSAIETVGKSLGDYEVSVWLLDGENVISKSSKPPFEVIVNSLSFFDDCFEAKNALLNLMKTLYSNPETKDNIARVKFTALGQLRASLGAKDVAPNWEGIGPSIFWKSLMELRSFENESSPINQRTYGVQINKSCL